MLSDRVAKLEAKIFSACIVIHMDSAGCEDTEDVQVLEEMKGQAVRSIEKYIEDGKPYPQGYKDAIAAAKAYYKR